MMNGNGECVVKNKVLNYAGKIRVFLNFMKRRGFKALFLAVDDLWLYNFHVMEYDGTVKVVFETIAFIEERQWEVVGLEEERELVEESVKVAQFYNPYSNTVYMMKERKNNLFISSTTDYFVFFLPATIILMFLLNRLFHCLFNNSISRYLRPYSFWWMLFELLFQGNV